MSGCIGTNLPLRREHGRDRRDTDQEGRHTCIQKSVRGNQNAINTLCWNGRDAFITTWVMVNRSNGNTSVCSGALIAGVVPNEKLSRFLKHLTNPNEFWHQHPRSHHAGRSAEFSPKGDYWRGSVWVPTNYMMILLGLLKVWREK